MASGGMNLEQQFGNFAKFGDMKTDGKTITLTNVDMWFQQAQIMDGKIITNTTTGVAFNKFRVRTITFKQFNIFLDDIAKSKDLDVTDVKDKLMNCGLPGADSDKEKDKKGKK